MLTTGDAQVMQLEEGGPPVGMFAQSRYQEQQIQLDPGSLLFTFTDGIPEALNPDMDEFGGERLIHLCQEHRSAAAGEVVDHVFRAVRHWQGDAEQFDDITMLAMKVR
jgi:serine phosphatase RsbU (regulator of sigma subunit)